jgi:hypothetical protein
MRKPWSRMVIPHQIDSVRQINLQLNLTFEEVIVNPIS